MNEIIIVLFAILPLYTAIWVAIFKRYTKKYYEKGYMTALGVTGRDKRELNKMTGLFQEDLFNVKIYGIWALEDWEPLSDIIPKLKRECDAIRKKDYDQWKRLMIMWAPILVSIKKGANDISISNASNIITKVVDAIAQAKLLLGDKFPAVNLSGTPESPVETLKN